MPHRPLPLSARSTVEGSTVTVELTGCPDLVQRAARSIVQAATSTEFASLGHHCLACTVDAAPVPVDGSEDRPPLIGWSLYLSDLAEDPDAAETERIEALRRTAGLLAEALP